MHRMKISNTLFTGLLDFSRTNQFADSQFADKTIRGHAHSWTRRFADKPIRGQDDSRTGRFADNATHTHTRLFDIAGYQKGRSTIVWI